jgi:hypothetical protein
MSFGIDLGKGKDKSVVFISIIKGKHRFVLIFDKHEKSFAKAYQQVFKWLCDPSLKFDLFDAKVMARKIAGFK